MLLLRDHAKLLWQRIPEAVKTASPELGRVWGIGKCLWQRDFASVYSLAAATPPWPDYIAPIIASLVGQLGSVCVYGRQHVPSQLNPLPNLISDKLLMHWHHLLMIGHVCSNHALLKFP